jgi:trehalose 6-phosphate phosphatase
MRQQGDSRRMDITRTDRDIAVPHFAPDLHDSAFLLDIDGTIIDIAPTPDAVRVPPALRDVLARLMDRTGGAVALVSGRSVRDIDHLFDPLRLTVVGGHGAEFRLISGAKLKTPGAVPLLPELRSRLAAIAGGGVLAEDKGYAVALHYRLVPDKEKLVRDAVAKICAEPWPMPIEIMPGKAVVEVKRAGFSKATGVRELMSHLPFAGRYPIFIGDDTTDESVFAIMPELDGIAFSVGRRVAGVVNYFESPAEVRDWLARMAGTGGGES